MGWAELGNAGLQVLPCVLSSLYLLPPHLGLNVLDWEESSILPPFEACCRRPAVVVGVGVYGPVSERLLLTRLAGASCHLLRSGIPAARHSVVLLGLLLMLCSLSVSLWAPLWGSELSLPPFPFLSKVGLFEKVARFWHLRKLIWDLLSCSRSPDGL